MRTAILHLFDLIVGAVQDSLSQRRQRLEALRKADIDKAFADGVAQGVRAGIQHGTNLGFQIGLQYAAQCIDLQGRDPQGGQQSQLPDSPRWNHFRDDNSDSN